MQSGINPWENEDKIDLVKHKIVREAADNFEKFIHDKHRLDSKELIIEAYEGVLYEQRKHEKEMLNAKRFKEFEKNRPP